MRFFVSSANSSVSSDSGKDGKPSLNGSGQGHSLQSSLSGLPNLTPSKTRKSCKYMYLAIENKQKFEVFNIHETLHKIQSMGVKKLGQNQFSKKKINMVIHCTDSNTQTFITICSLDWTDWQIYGNWYIFYTVPLTQWHGFIFCFLE